MSSLRLALKLSLQENPDAATTNEKQAEPFEALDAIVGRKRKGSLDKKDTKETRKKSREESRSKSKNGDDSNRDSAGDGSVAGDSFTSMGLNADEASVSSHAVNKDDETLDEDGTQIQDLGPEPATSMDIPKDEEAAAAPAPVEEVPVKMEKTDEEPTAEPEAVEPHDSEENAQLAVGSEDKQDEVASPRKAGGKGKKRLLKGLDVSEKDVAEALGEGEDDGPRYQTNRAAAMLAKSKLNVAATSTATAPTTTTTTTTKEAAPAVPTNAAKEPSRRGGWNRGTGRGAAVSAAANARLVPVVIEWVQCDACAKWRSVSPSIGSNSLPDQWVCADNTWDTKFNHCEAPEQSEEEAKAMYDIPSTMGPPSLDPPRVKRESSDAGGSVETPSRGDHEPINRGGRGGGRGRGGARGRRGMSANSNNANNASDDSGDDDEAPTSHRASRRNVNYAQADDPDYGRSTQKRRSSGVGAAAGRGAGRSARDLNASFATAAAEEVAIAAVDWVQCTKCAKWRKVPPHIDVNSLPDVWLCNMNNWNPAVAKCSAPEEVDEPVETPTAMAMTTTVATTPGRGHAGGGRGGGHNAARSAQHQAILQQMIAANAAAMAAAANAPPLAPGEIKRTQWVQCERKNCQKWRKVPAYIDISKFPAKWYCDLNFWSPDRAFCDVAEDVDSDEERKRKEARNNRNLLLGSNKGSAQLSYRRIIYGNDGKVRAQFAEKTKLGNGIFTYPVSARRNVSEDEEETHYFYREEHEPVRRVSYWWSTAFDDRLHQLHPHSLKVNETAPGPTTTTAATTTAATATTAEPATTSTSRKETTKEATKEATESFEFSLSSVAAAGASETPQPVASSYLIDTARRLHQMATGAVPAAWTTPHLHDTRALDAIDHVNSLTLYQRMTVETVVVRTLLMATTMAHVLFTELMAMLRDAQFLDPVHDACRFFLIDQKPAVVDVVHRMEERGEVEVAYTRDNKLVITLLPSMETLKQELAARRVCFQEQWQQQQPRRSAAFDPRQRKCFQGKYTAAGGGGGGEALGKAVDVPAAASTGAASNNSNSNNNNGTAPTATAAAAAAAANAMANVSDNTLRAVAMANNLPFRTNEDGSFVTHYPSSGPFKIPLSSAVVANLRGPVAPVLSYEESMIVAAAFSNGKASSSAAAGSAAQGGAHGGAAGAANGPGGLGPGGRGKRGGGGGGRGRGRGRGGAAATAAAADSSAAAAAAPTERPGAGRGATKRAAKAAADAAAAAAAAAAVAVAASPAPAAASPAPPSATATPSTDAAEVSAEKKARKPHPKRPSPSGADDANSDGADAAPAAMAVDAAASMDDDDDADSVGSQSSGPSTLEQVPKADDDTDSSSDDEDPDDADGDKTQSDDDDEDDDGDADDDDDDGGDSSDGGDGEKSTGSRASAAKNAPREDDDEDSDDDSDDDDNAKGDEANAASGSDDDSDAGADDNDRQQHGDAKAADDATAAASDVDHDGDGDDGDDAAPAATGAMDVDDGDAAVANGEDQTTHTAEDATLDGAASDRVSDSDGDVDAEPGEEQPSSTGGVEAKHRAASVADEVGVSSPAAAEDAAPSSAMEVDEEATAQQ